MYLLDTNVVSEIRKRRRANPGVRGFFEGIASDRAPVFLTVVTVGELRRAIELIAAIQAYVDYHNDHPKPFVWTANAQDIFAKYRRAEAILNKVQTA
jgi:hypothetical protein